MKYKISSIESGDCDHKMFDISHERHVELMSKVIEKVTLLDRVKPDGLPIVNVLKESLELVKNDQEAIYICFIIGGMLGKISTRLSLVSDVNGVEKKAVN